MRTHLQNLRRFPDWRISKPLSQEPSKIQNVPNHKPYPGVHSAENVPQSLVLLLVQKCLQGILHNFKSFCQRCFLPKIDLWYGTHPVLISRPPQTWRTVYFGPVCFRYCPRPWICPPCFLQMCIFYPFPRHLSTLTMRPQPRKIDLIFSL